MHIDPAILTVILEAVDHIAIPVFHLEEGYENVCAIEMKITVTASNDVVDPGKSLFHNKMIW